MVVQRLIIIRAVNTDTNIATTNMVVKSTTTGGGTTHNLTAKMNITGGGQTYAPKNVTAILMVVEIQ